MQFKTTSSPHLAPENSVSKVMFTVIAAMVPGLAVSLWLFGWGLAINIVLAVFTALLAESVILQARQKDSKRFLADGSAILTALLLAVAIPVGSPWWIPVIGVLFAIVMAKQLFGGLGYNPFNPAMVGYVVLLICFPVEMTQWQSPAAVQECSISFAAAWNLSFSGVSPCPDGLTSATVLDSLRTLLSRGNDLSNTGIEGLGFSAGAGWEWIALAWLCGGVFMLWRGVIKWHIPVSMLLSLSVLAILFWLIDPQQFPRPDFHLFAGATMLGAFFIATDPVSASTTAKGRLLYGAGIGVLIFIIRSWGGYPDAVAFAVLLMNTTAPMLDYYTQPRVFGHEK